VIALGSYHLDVREVQLTWRWVHEHPDPIAMVVSEGYLSVPIPVYGIGYGALIPRREECDNLVAAVCISASHVAALQERLHDAGAVLAVRAT
jgi:hypothetical protein